jgi:hypothetical protein
MSGFHPARTLDRLGLSRTAEILRQARSVAVHRPTSLGELPWLARSVAAWALEPLGRSAYSVLSEAELRATRRSDTAFVFGSGRSLVDIEPAAWERISRHDTIGFSQFHRQRWVRVDYHVVAEVADFREAAASLASSAHYRDTVYLVMKGILAHGGNELVARRLLPRGARIFRWRRVARGRSVPPSRSFADGLVHGSNTSLDVVNFALLMGWRRVVVAGVDLYDRNYFFLPPGTTRPDERPGWSAALPFHQADHVVEMLGLWREVARERGIELEVYDRRSRLAEVLPVFSWAASGA